MLRPRSSSSRLGYRFNSRLAVAVAVLGACGGADDPPESLDGGPFVDDLPITLDGPCESGERIGRFRLAVILDGTSAGSSISGKVGDRVDPTLARELVTETSSCSILRRLNPLCEPGCDADSVCSIDETCVPRALGVDVGPIRVGGLASNLEMEPRPPGNDYFDTTIRHPAISGSEELRLRSTSGDITLDGIGSEGLVVLGDDWAISEGNSLTITWTPPTPSTPSAAHTTVGLSLTIDQHGTTPVLLSCEFEDTGSAEVPAAVIDALLDQGVSGFPNARLERRTQDSAELSSGCVDFEVAHPRVHPTSVAGHTPCNVPADCPTGQSCDLGNNTCI